MKKIINLVKTLFTDRFGKTLGVGISIDPLIRAIDESDYTRFVAYLIVIIISIIKG